MHSLIHDIIERILSTLCMCDSVGRRVPSGKGIIVGSLIGRKLRNYVMILEQYGPPPVYSFSVAAWAGAVDSLHFFSIC